MKSSNRSWIGAAALAGIAVGLLIAEQRRPLRPVRDSKARRDLRNGFFALLSGAVVAGLQDPLVLPLAREVERRGWGLLGPLRAPRWVKVGAAIVLMDYTLYVWHVLTHRVPLLWRFHRPHHADIEMDASTALRFHFGEMALSVPYRAAQVAIIGVSPDALRLWQRLTLASVLFQHSNLRLPERVDRWLATILVTPRLHEIHHSPYASERETNWSSGLTAWDRLHGTYLGRHRAREIAIGDPDLRRPEKLSAAKMLALPFQAGAARWGRGPST